MYLLTAVAGGFAMTLVRNETQRHSEALKSAGQNPISLLPLDNRDRSYTRWSFYLNPSYQAFYRCRLILIWSSRPRASFYTRA